MVSKVALVTVGISASIAVVLVIVLPIVLTKPGDEPKPQLDTAFAEAPQGKVIGQVTDNGAMFFGMPFSQPPIGEYRWRKPRDPLDFDGIYDGKLQRPVCIQICHQPAEEYSCPQNIQSEDCLYLNVWVPKRLLKLADADENVDGQHWVIDETFTADGNGLAVMLWFYGGAFNNGAGTVTVYDSRFLADMGDVIAVTMNYRVGPLGFLVQGYGEDAALGNFGIWDQIFSLQWIQRNIQAFGGNPNKVTIFGQSAGAESVGVLMTSPYVTAGLFHQGLMESNPFGLPFRDTENAKEYGARFTMSAGCLRDDMECLRSIDTDTILRAYTDSKLEVVGLEKVLLIFQPWGPVIDGDFLPKQPVDSFTAGEALDIPLMLGSTIDEGMLFVELAFPHPINRIQYNLIVRTVFKNESSAVLSEYPPRVCIPGTEVCDQRLVMNDLATDFLFFCPQRAAIKALDMSKVYFYIFSQVWSFGELWELPLCFDRVCHAAELPYVFNIVNLTIYTMAPEEYPFSTRMQWYWSNFAKTGNPNTPGSSRAALTESDVEGIINWKPFNDGLNGETDYAVELNAGGDTEREDPYKAICEFWDNLDSYGDHRKALYDALFKL